MQKKKRAQTAIEYIFILGGAIMFVVIVVLIIRGNIFGTQPNKINQDLGNLTKCLIHENLLLYDNFDEGSDANWFNKTPAWYFQNKIYNQTEKPLFGAIGHRITLTRKIMSNFTMLLKVKLNSGIQTYAGAILRSDPAGYKYYLVIVGTLAGGQSYVGLLRRTGINGHAAITSAQWSPGIYNNETQLQIQANGTRIKVLVNNIQRIDFNFLPPTPVYQAGSAGLITFSANSVAEFDDVCIYN